MAKAEVTITLPRTEALALSKVADVGLRVVEALNLIQSTAAAERAIRSLDAQISSRR